MLGGRLVVGCGKVVVVVGRKGWLEHSLEGEPCIVILGFGLCNVVVGMGARKGFLLRCRGRCVGWWCFVSFCFWG